MFKILLSHLKLRDKIKLLYNIQLLCLLGINLISFGCTSNDNIDFYANLTKEQIYYQGKKHIKENKFVDAIKDFQALEVNYPYGMYADRAKLSLLYCYYMQKDYAHLKAVAERFLKIYPNHRYADYVYYMQGLASYHQHYSWLYKYLKIDRSKRNPDLAIEAFDYFKDLLERFPSSKYTAAAKNHMIILKDDLASHYLHIAKYYLQKGAYLAAANRAKDILVTFNDTIAVKAALEIMVIAYHNLNMPELEQQTINLLNNSFGSINNNVMQKKSSN